MRVFFYFIIDICRKLLYTKFVNDICRKRRNHAETEKVEKSMLLPQSNEFRPVKCGEGQARAVVLSVDEYETIRLIDHEGFSQTECAGYMGVARTTVQEIYSNARKKISVALVEAKPLMISGGEYRLCDGGEGSCRCGGCEKHKRQRENEKRRAGL